MASKFDMALIQRWLSPQGYQGFDAFIENLPSRVSQTVLIAAGVAWAVGGVGLVYANMQSEKVAKLRDELLKTEALKPTVPTIAENSVPVAEITAKMDLIKKVFKDLTITPGEGSIIISSEEPKMYGAFLQTIYTVMGLGDGYKITMKEMCQGRDCKTKSNKPFLYASFDVKKLEVKSTESPSGG